MDIDGRRFLGRRIAGMVTFTAVLVALLYVVADRIIEDVLEVESAWGQLVEVVIMAVVTSAVLWTAVLRPLHRSAREQAGAALERQRDLERHASRQQFEGQLHRALEMAATEEAALRTTAKALELSLHHGESAELLLADSSDAHLKRPVMVGERGCDVVAPSECPAVRRAQTLLFESSAALDACPHLDGRPSGPCSAVCVPVSVGGRSIGVLHSTSEAEQRPPTELVARLESIANQAGSRIGLLRVMSATTLQASTDPLTGLLNRRSFENRVHSLLAQHRPFALAMGDLDHFKRLNDTHGHEAGDRALRLFARVLGSSMRSDDIVSRYGGEEFVIVFPDRDADEAAGALRRMQEELFVELSTATVPPFTVSYGVTDTHQSSDLEELCRIADAALFASKRAGRNTVTTETSDDHRRSVVAHPGPMSHAATPG